MQAIAQAHPEARDEVIDLLATFINRPDADANAEQESLTASIINDLADLEATTAYDAILQAFAEGRVDTQIIRIEDVERAFGMRPPLDFGNPQPRKEPGVRLVLKCQACGREREHVFPRVYYDLGTAEDKQVEFINFTSRWGPMHPQEAIERYQRELALRPDDVSLHIGFGNVLRLLGRYGEADTEYERALYLDPDEPEVWVNMAQLAALRQDIPTTIRSWTKVQDLAHQPRLAREEQQMLAEAASDSLAELRQGRIPDFEPGPSDPSPEEPIPQPGAKPSGHPRVGRNDPCWCGSGKKYKRCHLAADKQQGVAAG